MAIDDQIGRAILFIKKKSNFGNIISFGKFNLISGSFLRLEYGITNFEKLIELIGYNSILNLDIKTDDNDEFHDFNKKIKSKYINNFNTAFDFGSGEHIMNFYQHINNIADSLKISGELFLFYPANNMYNHGFYQISASTLSTFYSKKNGFTDQKFFFHDINATSHLKYQKFRYIENFNEHNNYKSRKRSFIFFYAKKFKEVSNKNLMQPKYSNNELKKYYNDLILDNQNFIEELNNFNYSKSLGSIKIILYRLIYFLLNFFYKKKLGKYFKNF